MKRDYDHSSLSDCDSGENLMENLESDYVAIPELDTYDSSILDNRNFDAIDVITRREAEVCYGVYGMLRVTHECSHSQSEIDARHANREGDLVDHLDDFGEEGVFTWLLSFLI